MGARPLQRLYSVGRRARVGPCDLPLRRHFGGSVATGGEGDTPVVKTVLSQVVGAWLGFATIALFVRTVQPKDTAITCGWCGHPVPMKTAMEGGVGAVNLEMRTHMAQCESHPLHLAKAKLDEDKVAFTTIYNLCGEVAQLHPDRPLDVRRKLDRIIDIAGRMH